MNGGWFRPCWPNAEAEPNSIPEQQTPNPSQEEHRQPHRRILLATRKLHSDDKPGGGGEDVATNGDQGAGNSRVYFHCDAPSASFTGKSYQRSATFAKITSRVETAFATENAENAGLSARIEQIGGIGTPAAFITSAEADPNRPGLLAR